MKRILSLLIAVSVILSAMIIPFTVSAEADEIKENIGLLRALAIYEGDDGAPEHKITRAELAVMLGNIINANMPVDEQLFSDVPKNHYAASSVLRCHRGVFDPLSRALVYNTTPQPICQHFFSEKFDFFKVFRFVFTV